MSLSHTDVVKALADRGMEVDGKMLELQELQRKCEDAYTAYNAELVLALSKVARTDETLIFNKWIHINEGKTERYAQFQNTLQKAATLLKRYSGKAPTYITVAPNCVPVLYFVDSFVATKEIPGFFDRDLVGHLGNVPVYMSTVLTDGIYLMGVGSAHLHQIVNENNVVKGQIVLKDESRPNAKLYFQD